MCFLFPFYLSLCFIEKHFLGWLLRFVSKQQQYEMLQHFIFTTFGKICYKGFEMNIDPFHKWLPI